MIEISYECIYTNSIFQAFLSDFMFVSWIDCLIDGLLIKKRDHPYLDGNTILISVVTHYQRVLLTVVCFLDDRYNTGVLPSKHNADALKVCERITVSSFFR